MKKETKYLVAYLDELVSPEGTAIVYQKVKEANANFPHVKLPMPTSDSFVAKVKAFQELANLAVSELGLAPGRVVSNFQTIAESGQATYNQLVNLDVTTAKPTITQAEWNAQFPLATAADTNG